jgi:hypothetical protein
MDELASEDSLRLNVLLASKPLAIRLNESSLRVQALTPRGEIEICLQPVGRPDRYVRKVRELISGHILGSPGGYPVYLKRWTRMGQMRDESLEQLLLLAEPEAVTAAVCAPGLSDELARRAWWCQEDAGHARSMLANPAIRSGAMGVVLARYLVEHLAFESEPEPMIETVRLVLQAGLIDPETRDELWGRSARRPAYLVGFMLTTPEAIPLEVAPSSHLSKAQPQLQALAGQGNGVAGAMLRLLAPAGQAFLEAFVRVLHKPANQEVVVRALDAVRDYLRPFRSGAGPDQSLPQLEQAAELALYREDRLRDCLDRLSWLAPQLQAAYVLSGVGYGLLRPYLIDSTAVGSLMRRKLEPLTTALSRQIAQLR